MIFVIKLAALAITAAAASFLLIIQEIHLRSLNVRVAKVVAGVPGGGPRNGMTGWLSSLGRRYRRFYSDENLEQLRAIVQSSGFNHHRALPVWIGVKVVSTVLFPLVALVTGEFLRASLGNLTVCTLIGLALGIVLPRLLLSFLKKRFTAAIRKGTPDTIDLLVVCSEAGMGLEGAIERVAAEMARSNPAIARVLSDLLDDLRILPNRRDAFEKLAQNSEGLRRFGAMISQSMQYGTPLGQALRAIAEELRRDALIELEERAHKLGAKLILPMVLFLLPAMFVILGGSSFLHLARSFQM